MDNNFADFRISKKELLFIEQACNLTEKIFDFKNNSNSEFRKKYGMKKDEVNYVVSKLRNKVDFSLKKIKI